MSDFPLAQMGDPIARRAMTHYAPTPNPATPIIQGLQSFLSGGLQGVANQRDLPTPDWSKRLGTILTSPGANAALGVMEGGLKSPAMQPRLIPNEPTAYVEPEEGAAVHKDLEKIHNDLHKHIAKFEDIGSDLESSVEDHAAAHKELGEEEEYENPKDQQEWENRVSQHGRDSAQHIFNARDSLENLIKAAQDHLETINDHISNLGIGTEESPSAVSGPASEK